MSYINQDTRTKAALNLLMRVAQDGTDRQIDNAVSAFDVVCWSAFETERKKIYHELTGRTAPVQLEARKLYCEFLYRMKITGSSVQEKLDGFNATAREYTQTSIHSGYEPLEVQ